VDGGDGGVDVRAWLASVDWRRVLRVLGLLAREIVILALGAALALILVLWLIGVLGLRIPI
jgi:hypothetical protein